MSSTTYYQNQSTWVIAAPTASGIDVNVHPGFVVQGDIYKLLGPEAGLVEVPGPYTWPQLVYSWLDSGSGGGGGTGTITGVNCISPITGGGASGDVTVGLEALGITGGYIANGTITADKFAAGAAVTGLFVGATPVTGDVHLIAGTNISLAADTLASTITVSTVSNIVGAVSATAPIIADITTGTLNLSLAVTPADDGGAVALQADNVQPEQQDGIAFITKFISAEYISANVTYATIVDPATPASSLYLQPLSGSENLFTGLDTGGTVTSYLDHSGSLYSANLYNDGTLDTKIFSLRTDPWLGAATEKGHLTAVGADAANNFLNIPFALCNTLTLSQVASSPAERIGEGKIVGSPTLASLISFATGTYPAITLGTTSATTKDLALQILDNGSVTPTIGLYTDGTITCKRVDALFNTTKNVVLTAGNYLVADYPGVSTFVIDSASGVSSIALPELTSASEDGMEYTFKKYDVTTNAVLISTSAGQTIDVDKTQYTLTTYKQTNGSTTGTTPEPILHTLKVMSVVKPLDNKYFWISL
jgi:hypothetical protein